MPELKLFAKEEYDDEYMNTCLEEIPEIKLSSLGRYPMNRDAWAEPSEKINGDTPAFIPHTEPEGKKAPLKKDYVWGPNTHGPGYYHLWTKQAYKILRGNVVTELHRTSKLVGRLRYTEEEKEHRKRLQIAKEIFVLRGECTHPNESDPHQLDQQRNPDYVNHRKLAR